VGVVDHCHRQDHRDGDEHMQRRHRFPRKSLNTANLQSMQSTRRSETTQPANLRPQAVCCGWRRVVAWTLPPRRGDTGVYSTFATGILEG
jgi:hypothetical protein